MTVNELIKELQREKRNGNGKLEAKMFAHDHNPDAVDEGIGPARVADEWTNEAGETFVAIRA